MTSLRKGIGNTKDIEDYYDKWSKTYDETLYKWEYKAPTQTVNILKRFLKREPKYLLDLACGKGRHSTYLEKLGFIVTGIDKSINNIKK